MVRWLLLVLGAALACACKPDLAGRSSLVEGERILAIRSTPAEAAPAPGAPAVDYEALYVGPSGFPDPTGLDWAFCLERKPLAVTGPAAPSCLMYRSPALEPFGAGATAQGALPQHGCRVFGPNPPLPKPGEPAARPADPDVTGGYYQPVRVMLEGHLEGLAVGVTRLECGLGAATQAQAIEYTRRHRPNENPALTSLRATQGAPGTELLTGDGSASLPVPRSATVLLRAEWPSCPLVAECGDGLCSPGENATGCAADCATAAECQSQTCRPHGCTGAESYLTLDPETHQLAERREAIRVSWFATDGEFEHDRTGRSAAEAATAHTENRWTAPGTATKVSFWVVVRDDRGGVGWGSFSVEVGK